MRKTETEKRGEDSYSEGREGEGGIREEGRLNVLIHRNTASNQCTALRLAEQLRGVRQQYIHVPTEGQREGAERAS